MFEAQDVVEIPLIDINIFVLFLTFGLFKQLQIDFHAFSDAVVRNGPSTDQSIVDLALLDAHDEMPRTVPHSLFQILDELLGVFAKIDIDSLSLGLQNTIFVDQDESHLITKIGLFSKIQEYLNNHNQS